MNRDYIHKAWDGSKLSVQIDEMNSHGAFYRDGTPCRSCFLVDEQNVVQAYMYDSKLAQIICDKTNK